MNGAQAIAKSLQMQGVKTVFGYPGVAICPVFDSLLETDIHSVLVRIEANAAHMASGFARLNGEVGVAICTSGPGATNLITGIATAYADSIPLVCITGQVNSALVGSDVFQEADITGAAESFVKYYVYNMYGVEIEDFSDINSDFAHLDGYVYIIPRGFSVFSHKIDSVSLNEDGSFTVVTSVSIDSHDGDSISRKAVSLFVKNDRSRFGYNIISSEISDSINNM